MTRHAWSLCALLLLAPATLRAQGALSSYDVPAGSRGNTIILTIVNESTAEFAEGIHVRLASAPQTVVFAENDRFVERLEPGGEVACAFAFQVKRDAVPLTADTLHFLVTDNLLGLSWKKSVVLRYAGPSEYRLLQNYPNPFNPRTTIAFDLPGDARVKIAVYDLLGRELKVLLDEMRAAGCYDIAFDALDFASGVYFYRMTAEPLSGGKPFAGIRRMMVVK